MRAEITNRQCLVVKGADAFSFLQGLVTNDLKLLDDQPALYSCFLTPQGKFLYDFIMTKQGENAYILEVLEQDLEAFLKRLKVYALRSHVSFETLDYKIYAIWNEVPPQDSYVDPRFEALGARLIAKGFETNADFSDYTTHRILQAVPDGSLDLKPSLSTLYDGNLDLLNAISFDKGCYLGQELTARMHYRGLIKKRMFAFEVEGSVTVGDAVMGQDGKRAGEIYAVYKSDQKAQGLAVLKLVSVSDQMRCGAHQTNLTILQSDRFSA